MGGKGTVWIVVTLIAASMEPILVKLGYKLAVTPFQLLAIKNIVGALLILPLTRTWRWLSPREMAPIAVVAALLFATNALTLFALKSLSAVIVITVLTATPAVVALANQALGRDKLTKKFWAGFAMCVGGILLTLDFKSAAMETVGVTCMCLAVLSSTTYRVRMESVTAKFTPALVSTYIFLLNGIATALFVAPFVISTVPKESIPLGLWMGVTAALANVAFVYALKAVGSTRISVIIMFERPLLIVLAAIILKEVITFVQGVGIALVFFGIQIAKVKKPAAKESSGSSQNSEKSEQPENPNQPENPDEEPVVTA